MPEIAKFFTDGSCIPNKRIFSNVQLLGPYWGNVLVIMGPFLTISTRSSRCLKWLKFSLKNYAYQIEENFLMLNYLDHIGAMFGPY